MLQWHPKMYVQNIFFHYFCFPTQLICMQDIIGGTSHYTQMIGNQNDFLCSRVSYKLNLRGPAMTIQTACSTGLVAIDTACRQLNDSHHPCDIALAGGVSLGSLHAHGYTYESGMILSPDGHCRPFDKSAAGTVPSQGCGVVVLKRMADALLNNDTILAVVKGHAINNDGQKAGFVVPTVEGQAGVVREALAMAGVQPSDISFVETHGTGTAIGDMIEISALKKVFGNKKSDAPCFLGALKSFVGHMDTASGVGGFIKSVLSLQHHQLPPVLHFKVPNPQLELHNSPFSINSKPVTLETKTGSLLHAGVSSFGIGGTNCHVVLAEHLPTSTPSTVLPFHILVLSAKTAAAATRMVNNLLEYMTKPTPSPISDVSYTLQVGRAEFKHRVAFVASDLNTARVKLQELKQSPLCSVHTSENLSQINFMFPGQGAQHPRMLRHLYSSIPSFQLLVDECISKINHFTAGVVDLRNVLWLNQTTLNEEAASQLNDTRYTQPALFTVEYCVAKLLISWGIQPRAMIGHSIGEYVAACLAGVFSLDDALRIVCLRGSLIHHKCERGSMLAVPSASANIQDLLHANPGVSLAVVNAPNRCVIAGPTPSIKLLHQQIPNSRILHTSHAFHSQMMEPVVGELVAAISTMQLSPPQLPFLSCVSGTWITNAQATDPQYWGAHLRQTVLFAPAFATLTTSTSPEMHVCLEVGPGSTLCTLAKQSQCKVDAIIPTLPPANDKTIHEVQTLFEAVAKVWAHGGAVLWEHILRDFKVDTPRRVPLPTYPFERKFFMAGPQVSYEKGF